MNYNDTLFFEGEERNINLPEYKDIVKFIEIIRDNIEQSRN